MKRQILVLGAGFGGLEVSTRLAERLMDVAEVTLLEQHDTYVFGPSKLDVALNRRTADQVRLPYARLLTRGVDVRQERVLSIDPQTRHVRTDEGWYDPHVVVVALGAQLDLTATPGLVEGGHEFASLPGAERLRDRLQSFAGGAIVIGALGPAFAWAPAPYEAALLLHDYLVERDLRERSSIHVVSPLPMPIPVSAEASAAVEAAMAARGIKYTPGSRVRALDPAARTAEIDGADREPYDLFIGIPVHKAPDVLADAGLTEYDGWVHVDPASLRTRAPGVYAVGDCVEAGVIRAGLFTEAAARCAAEHVAVSIVGGGAPPFRAKVRYYVEMGRGEVGRIEVAHKAGEAPSGEFLGPAPDFAAEKIEAFEERRRRWFGL